MSEDHLGENRINNYLIIIIFSILVRFLTMFYVLDKKYWFINNSSPYYLLYDSWYYAKILSSYLPNILIYFLGGFITICGLIIFYELALCKGIKKKYALYSTILISFFPYIFNQTYFGYVDTNHIIFFCFVSFLYLIHILINTKDIFKKIISIILIILNYLIIKFVWNGYNFIIYLIIYILITSIYLEYMKLYYNNKNLEYLLITIISIMPTILLIKMTNLFRFHLLRVAEYKFPNFVLYHFLVIYLIYIIFKKRNYNLFSMGLLVTYVGSLLIQRISLFTCVFGFILLGIELNRSKYVRKAVLFISICLLILMIFVFPKVTPGYTNNSEHAIKYIPINAEIINLWDNGHFINYFNRTTRYKAFPIYEDLINLSNGLYMSEEDGVYYLDSMSLNSDYYVFLLSEDFKKLKDNYNVNDSLYYKIKNNINLKYYDLFVFKNTYILKRNEVKKNGKNNYTS